MPESPTGLTPAAFFDVDGTLLRSTIVHYYTYFRRRRWDYFVRHLIGMTPPDHYLITTPSEYPHSGTPPDVVRRRP